MLKAVIVNCISQMTYVITG